MKTCRLCHRPFEPFSETDDPAVQAGLILAREKYADAASICRDCLASRGRLAMMYDPEVYD